MGAFSGFRDKRSKQNKHETPTVNAHYTKLAQYSAWVRYLCLIFIVVFAVYSLSFHSSEITIENFRYMLKFISFGDSADTPTGSFISFDGGNGNRGLIFKGDLAVLNESGLTITGWDGEVLHKSTFSFDHPKIEQNGVNLFCYDLGGKDLRVFNSYSQVWAPETDFEYPIYWLAASESGGFALVSSAKGYRSAVYVYDSAFRLVYSRLFGDKYVDFVDVSADGKEVITAAHYSKDGNLVTTLSKFRIDSEQILFEKEFIGEIPLGIYYTDNGYCLITSDAMRTFDNEDSKNGEIAFAGKELLSGKVFGSRSLVTYALAGLSGGTEVVVYRPDGSTEFSHSFKNSLSDILICGNTLYTLSPSELAVCDIVNGTVKTYSVPSSYSALIADEERLILFSESQAEYFDPAKFTEQEVTK